MVKLNATESYIYGFIASDGHCEKKRGYITIELSLSDLNILLKIQKKLKFKTTITYRTRDTNFAKQYKCACLHIHNHKFISKMLFAGMIKGKKSNNISIPKIEHSEKDFWRGFIDGDGSLGFRKSKNIKIKRPYISIYTNSNDIYEHFKQFIKLITGAEINVNINKRDGGRNIIISIENAQNLIKHIYYKNNLSLNRKQIKANKILLWKRKPGMRRSMPFLLNEDELIIKSDLSIKNKSGRKKIAKKLGRTVPILIQRKILLLKQ